MRIRSFLRLSSFSDITCLSRGTEGNKGVISSRAWRRLSARRNLIHHPYAEARDDVIVGSWRQTRKVGCREHKHGTYQSRHISVGATPKEHLSRRRDEEGKRFPNGAVLAGCGDIGLSTKHGCFPRAAVESNAALTVQEHTPFARKEAKPRLQVLLHEALTSSMGS